MNNIILTNSKELFDQAEQASNNSVLLENSSTKTLYINEELNNYKETDLNLYYFESWFYGKYYERLVSTAKTIYLNTLEEKSKYFCDPMKMSYDQYGTTNYWYLILLLNDMAHPTEFRDLNRVLIPDEDTVSKIIAEEEANEKALNQN